MLGEGLLVSDEGHGWWVDIPKKMLFSNDGAANTVFALPEVASKVLAVQGRKVTLATESGLSRLDLDAGQYETLCVAPPLSWKGESRSNDACILRNGDILVGRMDLEPRENTGDVVRYRNGVAEVILTGIAIPNTFVELSLEQRNSLLISDSLAQVTWCYDIESLSAQNDSPEIWHDFRCQTGTPDGGILASDDHVYIAMWGAGCVTKFNMNGEIIAEFAVPALQPTSVQENNSFNELWVTTATEGMTQSQLSQYEGSGYLLRLPLRAFFDD
ncbi:SMP-30/gluconolactonase/LRE family protein [Luminiphilus sp. nBUS_07]|uniref:SMP-30/gluconolactonase/LRE family protein n=1 Tax=Luminiphilus sp. nBUS_07 TaxID=3395314 RepID=UPI003EBEC68A